MILSILNIIDNTQLQRTFFILIHKNETVHSYELAIMNLWEESFGLANVMPWPAVNKKLTEDKAKVSFCILNWSEDMTGTQNYAI